MKRFKWLRSVRKSHDEQAMIFYTCATFELQSAATRRKIERLCVKAAAEYSDALLEFLTTKADFRYICTKYAIGDSTLDRVRKRFYELW